jgi:hypothetical protein
MKGIAAGGPHTSRRSSDVLLNTPSAMNALHTSAISSNDAFLCTEMMNEDAARRITNTQSGTEYMGLRPTT